jgi:hypothetical protein
MRVVIHPESIQVSSNLATGIIHFVVGDRSFPSADWNDFVNVVPSWWGGELVDLVQGKRSQVTLRFMDGPFAVDLMQLGDRCGAVFKNADAIEFRRDEIDLGELLKSVMSAIDAVLNNPAILEQKSKETADIWKAKGLLEQEVRKMEERGRK